MIKGVGSTSPRSRHSFTTSNEVYSSSKINPENPLASVHSRNNFHSRSLKEGLA